MSVAIGTVILGRYRVQGRLGRGAIGEVYAAVDHEGRPVAVKVLLLQERSLAARFIREAAFMARVRHENVVQVIDFGSLDDETPCLVMERVEGRSLDERLRESRALPWPEAVATTRAVLAGLTAIHEAGVLHRDLKPANVMEDAATGQVKVLDFGIAKAIAGTARGVRLTATGTTVGTPAYMAPEQFAGTPEIRSDLYSAALMLYELLTGDVPFGLQGEAAITRRMFEPIPPPVAPERFPRVPDTLAQLILQGLAPRASARLPDARTFSEALGFCVRLGDGGGDAGTLRLEPDPSRTLPLPEVRAVRLAVVRVPPGASVRDLLPSAVAVAEDTFACLAADDSAANALLRVLRGRFGLSLRTLIKSVPGTFTLPAPGAPRPAVIEEMLERLDAFAPRPGPRHQD